MSKLEEISEEFRNKNLKKNSYSNGKSEYSSSSKNALSDGDAKGKGENNGSVGSSDDIKTRTNQTSKNDFNLGGKEYNLSNF